LLEMEAIQEGAGCIWFQFQKGKIEPYTTKFDVQNVYLKNPELNTEICETKSQTYHTRLA